MYISAISSLSKANNTNYGQLKKTEKKQSNVAFKAYSSAIESAIKNLQPKSKTELRNGVETLIRNVVYERGTMKHYGASILTGDGSLETKLTRVGRQCSYGDTLVSKDGDTLISAMEDGIKFHGSQEINVTVDDSKLVVDKHYDKYEFGPYGGKHVHYDSDFRGSHTTHYDRFGKEKDFRNFVEDVFGL